MKCLWNSFKIAFAMYSKIPMPRADWEKKNMRYMMCFFPLIGVVIGVCMVLWSLLAQRLGFSGILRSAGFVLVPLAITGGIHLDGLLDTADALSSCQPRERKLEILKDSNAGAFAVICCCCYFLAAFGIWSELGRQELLVLTGGYVLSRALSGLAVADFPCARHTGTVAMFSDAAQQRIVEICMYLMMMLAAAFMCVMDVRLGTAGVLAAAAFYIFYYCMSKKEFGGITGDIAGFFLQLCELFMAAAVLTASRL